MRNMNQPSFIETQEKQKSSFTPQVPSSEKGIYEEMGNSMDCQQNEVLVWPGNELELT